jgi:hypothetical protein
MAPTDNNKWAVLRELALACFLGDEEVVGAMRRAEELADQQPGDAAAFMAAMEAVVLAKEEKRVGEACQIIDRHPRTVADSRQAEEEASMLATAVTL